MAKTRVRKGMPSSALTKAEFTRRARERFVDPAFEGLQAEIDRIIDAAWVAVHGVMIVTPVSWYQAPSGLKAMMDRLVCADGGNPDPTTTQGKDPAMAKEIELEVRNAARSLVQAVRLMRSGKLAQPDARLADVRPK